MLDLFSTFWPFFKIVVPLWDRELIQKKALIVGFLRSLLGFQEGYAPFSYLVVPIFKGNPRREFFRNITEKVQSRLEGC